MNLYHYKATVVSVYDGDTITVDIDLGFNATLRMAVRLARINAPEVRGEQRAAGLTAAEALRQWLPVGEQVYLKTYKDGREKYGRYLAEVLIDLNQSDGLTNINDWLVVNGYAQKMDLP